MYAKVIPAVRLPRNTGYYDYSVPDRLAPAVGRGSIVVIPWRRQLVGGLVLETSRTTDVLPSKVREVAAMGSLDPVNDELIGTLIGLAKNCYVSPATALQAFLPPIPRRRFIKALPDCFKTRRVPTVAAGPLRPECRLFRYASPLEKYDATEKTVRRNIKEGKTAVIVVPHLTDLERLLSRLTTAGLPAIELSGRMNAGDLWSSWLRISSGEPVAVIGTRLAVMAPSPRLGTIIIHESDSPDLKQYDQNPRYDARKTALIRSTASGCGLWLMGTAWRAEEHVLIEKGEASGEGAGPSTVPTVIAGISGPEKELRLVSPAAAERTGEALQAGKKALYFHNRRGTATALVCGDCRHVFRCPECDAALAGHEGALRCPRCGRDRDLPLACPGCGGARLRTVGFGTAALEKILKKLFPEARVARIDRDSAGPGPSPRLDADILIGTHLLIHELTEDEAAPSDIGAVIVAEAESLLGRSGFRSTEAARRTIARLRDLASTGGGDLLVQALGPDDPAVRDLLAEWPRAAQAELAERRRAALPPYGVFGCVIVSAGTEEEVKDKAAALKRRLAACDAEKTEIFPPARPSRPHRHGRWLRLVAFKTISPLPPELDRTLRDLPDEYIIDIDPEMMD